MELQVPGKFENGDDHIYDIVEPTLAATTTKKGKTPWNCDTSFSNPHLLKTPESSMEFSKGTTLGDRSKVGNNTFKAAQPFRQTTRSNDYEEHTSVLGTANPLSATVESPLTCSEYEVPVSAPKGLHEKSNASVEYSIPETRQHKPKINNVTSVKTPQSNFNSTTDEDYEIPQDSITPAAKLQGKSTEEDHYDIPCLPNPSVRTEAGQVQKIEADDEDYMSMDGYN